MFPSLPNPFFNLVLLSGTVPRNVLEEVLDSYQAAGAPLDLEISPGAVNEEMVKLLQAGEAEIPLTIGWFRNTIVS